MVFRKALRTKTGCLRCRQRHVKCDETRPRCSFCTRWNVDCTWPLNGEQGWHRSQHNPSQGTIATNTRHDRDVNYERLILLANPEKEVKSLDVFHDLPVIDKLSQPVVLDGLQYFFTCILKELLPFNIVEVRKRLALDWLEMIFADEAVCWAFAAYGAELKARRICQSDVPQSCLHLGVVASHLIRSRLELESEVTEGTLLAAAVHFVWAALNWQTIANSERFYSGIEALINARGGFHLLVDQVSRGTLQYILMSDTLNSLLTVQPLRYQSIVDIHLPASLDIAQVSQEDRAECLPTLEPPVMELIGMVGIALSLRTQSKSSRSLTSTESAYIMSLLQQVDQRLCTLQTRFLGTCTISEITILGLILVRQEVISQRAQHRALVSAVLQRLQSAILRCKQKDLPTYQVIAVWASIIAFSSSEEKDDRSWFLKLIAFILDSRYQQGRWLSDWAKRLLLDVNQVIWHERMEARYFVICHELALYNDASLADKAVFRDHSVASFNLWVEMCN